MEIIKQNKRLKLKYLEEMEMIYRGDLKNASKYCNWSGRTRKFTDQIYKWKKRI